MQHNADHVRQDIETFDIPDLEQMLTLTEFWEVLKYEPKDFEHYHLDNVTDPTGDFEVYMDRINETAFSSLTDVGA
jgi:hypothetical protein